MEGLTDRQMLVLRAIATAIQERGYPPTIREIGARMNISTNGVNDHLRALERKGYIRCEPMVARSIALRDRALRHIPRAAPAAPSKTFQITLLGSETTRSIRVDAHQIAERDPAQVFGFRVINDAMRSDGILEGDTLLCAREHHLRAVAGKLVVVQLADQLEVRRCIAAPRHLHFVSGKSGPTTISVELQQVPPKILLGVAFGLVRTIGA